MTENVSSNKSAYISGSETVEKGVTVDDEGNLSITPKSNGSHSVDAEVVDEPHIIRGLE